MAALSSSRLRQYVSYAVFDATLTETHMVAVRRSGFTPERRVGWAGGRGGGSELGDKNLEVYFTPFPDC